MKMIKKTVAVLLAVLMLLTVQQGAFLALSNMVAKAAEQADKIELPNFIPENLENRPNHIQHLSEYDTEYLSAYLNEDGSRTVYSFIEPVRFVDGNGNLIDYDSRLKKVTEGDKKNAGYEYEIVSSDVSILMPEDIVTNKYVSLEYDKYRIELKPITDLSKAKEDYKTDDKYKAFGKMDKKDKNKYSSVEYLSADSDDININYYVSNRGVKEEIVLNSVPATNIFQFEYKLKNLVPNQRDDGTILFLDEKSGEVVSVIEPLYMFDSYQGEINESGLHYSENIQLDIEQDKNSNNKYIFTITIDEAFLNDENTIYPVIIDPSQTLTLDMDNTEVLDTFVTSKYPNNVYPYSTSNRLGVSNDWSTARTYVKAVIPIDGSFDPYDIQSAIYHVENIATYTSDCHIDLYRVTENWSYTGTSWNTKPNYNTLLQNSIAMNSPGEFEFNITSLVTNWAKYKQDSSLGYPNYGFLVKERDEDGTRFRSMTAANHATSPSYIEITYVDADEEGPNDVVIASTEVNAYGDSGNIKVAVNWNSTTDNPYWHYTGVKEYVLTLVDEAENVYDINGSVISSENSITVPHVDTTSEYTQEFLNLSSNTVYYCKIKACDNAATPNWSGETTSDPIIGEMIMLSVSPSEWTNSDTAIFTWSGIEDTDSVYYSIDNGSYNDTEAAGADGTCQISSLGLSSDGEYVIKLAGVDETANPYIYTTLCQEAIFKYDNTDPIIDITNPDYQIGPPEVIPNVGNNLIITGGLSDNLSGIDDVVVEYGSGDPVVWTEIESEYTSVDPYEFSAVWDTTELLAGNYQIRITAADAAGNQSEEIITVNKISTATLAEPTNVAASTDNNYMITVDWVDLENPIGTTYEVYRGTTSNFTKDSSSLLTSGITTSYWNDFTGEQSTSYYYAVRALDSTGLVYSDFAETAASVTITANNEITEMLGMQDFWTFSGFSAGNGAGYINVANGNLVYSATDSVFPGYMLAMVMRRTYNSQSDTKSSLGYGWDFSYNTCLYKENIRTIAINEEEKLIYDLILKDGDGSLHYFAYYGVADNTWIYTAPDGIFMEMTYDENADEYTIIRKDYVTYTFDSNLKIKKLAESNGNYLKFNYDDAGKLSGVENCKYNGTSVNQTYFFYYQGTDSTASLYKDPNNSITSSHIGLLAAIMDEAGRVYKYDYKDGYAYLETFSYDIPNTSNDYTETYMYSGSSYTLSGIIDANNDTTSITYDGNKADTITYPGTNPESFSVEYNDAQTYTLFDDAIQLSLYSTSVSDIYGNETEYAYNSSGLVIITTDALGNKTEYTYNNSKQVTKVEYENYVYLLGLKSLETNMYYDSNHNITGIEDAKGHTTSMTYSDKDFPNKVSTISYFMNATQGTNDNPVVTANTYDINGNIATTTDAKGNVTTYEYYEDNGYITGLLKSVTTSVGTLGTKTAYIYNDKGWLVETRQGARSISNIDDLTTISKVVAYDIYGNPTITEDAMGIKSRVKYNELGLPIKTYLPDVTIQDVNWNNNKFTTAEYDLKGMVLSTTDISGIETEYDYDDLGRLIGTTVNNSIESAVSYGTYTNANGVSCAKIVYTGAEGTKSIEYYDELGRVVKTAISDGTSELDRSIMEYDNAGNLTNSKTLIEGTSYSEVKYKYNELNQLVRTSTYSDAVDINNQVYGWLFTDKEYDYVGNVISEKDADDNYTYYKYDRLNRLALITQYNGIEDIYTIYSYDNIASYDGTSYVMNSITDAEGGVKQTYLDEFGRAVVEINQGAINTSAKMVVERTYNDNGTIATMTQADGQVDEYTYNNWGQITKVLYDSEGAAATLGNDQTTYTYNMHGQMSSITDRRTDLSLTVPGSVAEVSTYWAYDIYGRTVSTTQDGVTIRYEYNDANQVTKLIQPTSDGGTSVEATKYEYNGYGQLASVYHNYHEDENDEQVWHKIRDYTYNYNGQVLETMDYLTFDNNGDTTKPMKTRYSYTNTGQVERIRYADKTDTSAIWPDTRLEDYNYKYDKRGNIIQESITNEYDGYTNIEKTYSYDRFNRLIQSVINGTETTTYTYDNVGNRKTQLTSSNLNKYNYNEFYQMMSIQISATIISTCTYDDRGAQLTELDADGYGTYYTYDKAGNLHKEEKTALNYTTRKFHFYNGMEQRIRRITDRKIVKYIYSGNSLLFTANENNDKITEDILSPSGQIIASQRFEDDYAGKYYFYNQDIRGSITSLVHWEDEEEEGATATVTITVNETNDTPTAVKDRYRISTNTELTVSESGIMENDILGDGTNTVTVTDDADYGTLTLNENGSFTYMPNTGFIGIDTFTYEIEDENEDTDTESVQIVVYDVVPLKALNDAYVTSENTTLEVDDPGILKNDILGDGVNTIKVTDDADHGTLTFGQDGSFIYIPDENFTGTDTFTYKVENAELVGKIYYTYDEFGKETKSGDYKLKNFSTYTGAVDESDNVYNMNARFYNANTGRFLTQDTYRGNAYEPMSQNLYTYCGNNPTTMIDPTGHNYYNGTEWVSSDDEETKTKLNEANSKGRETIINRFMKDKYSTMDETAIDWASKNMAESIDRDLEYGTIIYKQQLTLSDGTMIVGYGYGKLIIGTKAKVNTSLAIVDETGNSTLPYGITPNMVVATIHTHGNFLPGEERDHPYFSKPDKVNVSYFGTHYLVFRPSPYSIYASLRRGNAYDEKFDMELWHHYSDGSVDYGYQGSVINETINIE